MPSGIMILVVGPSGAGKDTLIAGARRSLGGDPGIVFARRVITRPRDSGYTDIEDYEDATEKAFAEREQGGGFMITWRAHGLCYGLTGSLEGDLAAGRDVVANVSRTVLADLLHRFPTARIIEVTAPPEMLARRLALRGREHGDDLAERLTHEAPDYPPGANVTTVVNDASPEEGARRLLAVLTGSPAPR